MASVSEGTYTPTRDLTQDVPMHLWGALGYAALTAASLYGLFTTNVHTDPDLYRFAIAGTSICGFCFVVMGGAVFVCAGGPGWVAKQAKKAASAVKNLFPEAPKKDRPIESVCIQA